MGGIKRAVERKRYFLNSEQRAIRDSGKEIRAWSHGLWFRLTKTSPNGLERSCLVSSLPAQRPSEQGRAKAGKPTQGWPAGERLGWVGRGPLGFSHPDPKLEPFSFIWGPKLILCLEWFSSQKHWRGWERGRKMMSSTLPCTE